MGLLDGQHAIVTGGASGIGAATCRRMTDEGARVADLRHQRRRRGGRSRRSSTVSRTRVDVTDFDAMQAAVDDAPTQLGGLSLLYNNAGGSNIANVHEWAVDEWRRIVDLNLNGVFHGFKAAVPHILAGGGGAIVSTASISGTRPSAGEAPYSAAKAAVVALTANAALEYTPTIRVNAVSPA